MLPSFRATGWSLCVVVVFFFTTGWSTFCPVTSPFDRLVYVTDNANQTKVGLTKTECALQCVFSDVICRCFNYNSTSMNCSLFNYEPTHYNVDQSTATVAYQLSSNPLRGLWRTVNASSCVFPFVFDGVVYTECRHGVVNDRYCSNDYYACYLPTGQPAFCIPRNVTVNCPNSGSYPYVVDAVNCSFPFTYNGALYFNCMTSMAGVTSNCAPFACLMKDRTAARCYPPADFLAKYIAVTVTTSGQPNVTTQSVFGWIVIMTRNGTGYNWTLPWNSYKNGFSLSNTDFWLGLERIHQLTTSANYRLRVEVYIPPTKNWCSGEYRLFSVGSEANGYKINIAGGFLADLGDQFTTAVNPSWNINGRNFSTYDADSSGHCVRDYGGGGWWYNNCAGATLTAVDGFNYWYIDYQKILQSRLMIKLQ